MLKTGPVGRYLRQYFRPSPGLVTVQDSTYTRAGRELRASVYRPGSLRRRAPAWIVLHGLTYHGPRHPGLQRFASALAASGHVVFIPEIREWSRLLVAPLLTLPTILAAADAVAARDDVDAERIGVFGFSFGATHAIAAAGDVHVAQGIRAITAWGGYAEVARLVEFGLTGEFELDGVRRSMTPDPYGRWIVAANYLTDVPGYGDMGRVTDALLQLATEAGRSGVFAGDPMHEPLKRELAAGLDARERRVYELFAPVGPHNLEAARAFTGVLAATIVAKDPLMEPGPRLQAVRIPVLLAHGRDDRLIPYTESLLLKRRIPKPMVAGCTITDLFAHSGGREPGLGLGLVREGARFINVLNRILTTL
jgi:acetyl esterase/lipase